MGDFAQGQREKLGTRLGFLFVSAGCAIGLGNIWRFPYITGKYGGAAFVLIFIIFLICMSLPVMIMEFSVGRGAQANIGLAFRRLEPKGTWWHIHGYSGIIGNLLLMMFYTTVTGWMLAYFWYTVSGQLTGLAPDQIGAFFGATLESPATQVGWMVAVVLLGYGICALGLQTGVEKASKIMMSGLFLIVIILAVRAVTLPGAGAGVEFYLKPDFGKLMENGLWEPVYAAMGQAFFTLSVGIGSMLIFGSYINRNRSLAGEGLTVMGLDFLAAFLAGMVIFPACFAYGVEPGAGPGLVFVSLPNVFNNMSGGVIWGGLFFLFMTFAAMTTVIAVFENLVSYGIDVWHLSRGTSVIINLILMLILATPCALGFNVLADFNPLGPGSVVLDLEDFLVSNTLLPLGALGVVLFCSSRYGWGWDNFIKECNTGSGVKFPPLLKPYFQYVLPVIILVIFVVGYHDTYQRVFPSAEPVTAEELAVTEDQPGQLTPEGSAPAGEAPAENQ